MKLETLETFLSLLSNTKKKKKKNFCFFFQYQAKLNTICMVQFLTNDLLLIQEKKYKEKAQTFRSKLIQFTQKTHGQMIIKTEGYHSQVTLKFSLLQMTQLFEEEEEKEKKKNNSQSELKETSWFLRKLREAQQNGLIQKVSLETFSFHYLHEEIEEKQIQKIDEIVAFLYEKNQRLEKVHIKRLSVFFQALKNQAAFDLFHNKSTNASITNFTKRTLEESISKYFDEDKEENNNNNQIQDVNFLYEMGFEKLTLDNIQMIEKTIQNFLQEEKERLLFQKDQSLQWKSLCITKILQGLSTVCFPAKEWYTSRFWRCLLPFSFDQVLCIVQKILQEEEDNIV
jgi:hypothetical protein